MQLKQKRWRQLKIFEIVAEGLRIETKTQDKYDLLTVKFEDIGFDEHVKKYQPSRLGIVLFISVFFNVLLCLICFEENFKNVSQSTLSTIGTAITVGMTLWAILLFKFETLKYIKGRVNIAFWYFKKYQAEVDAFIIELKNARRLYFREKYLKIHDTEEHFVIKGRLNWLKDEGYIDDDELKQLLTTLSNRIIIKGF